MHLASDYNAVNRFAYNTSRLAENDYKKITKTCPRKTIYKNN